MTSERTAATRGAWSIGIGAGLWGLFWIPLRYLDDAGIAGLWSVTSVSFIGAVTAIFVLAVTGHIADLRQPGVFGIGFALGLSTVLYFAGVLISDVIRVVFLFYLLPVWTLLAARVLHGVPIRPLQYLVITLALTGLWLLLGGGKTLPLPNNIGDVCGLAAGFCWGVSLALLRDKASTPPLATSTATLLVAAVLASAAALFPTVKTMPLPTLGSFLASLPVTAAFGALVLLPAIFGQVWGAQRVPAPTAALLTMSEIVVAMVSASMLIGTTLDATAIFGGLLIVAAVTLDIVMQRMASGSRAWSG